MATTTRNTRRTNSLPLAIAVRAPMTAPNQVAGPHEEPEKPQDRPGDPEDDEGSHIRADIDDLRGGRCLEERQA